METVKPEGKLGAALRQCVERLRLSFERIKPFADVLAPLALVFFAYKADEVSRQLAAAQELQAQIQRSEISPVFEVYFDDDRPKEGHKGARIRVVNISRAAMQEVKADKTQIISLRAYDPK